MARVAGPALLVVVMVGVGATLGAPGEAGGAGHPPNAPAPPSRYAVATAAGAVATFAGAVFAGDATDPPPASPVVAITATADRRGYWLAEEDGVVRAYGDAAPGTTRPAISRTEGPTVGLTRDPARPGWWSVSASGDLTAGGGAPSLGGPGAPGAPPGPADPVTGVAAAAGGRGAWLAHRDGTVSAVGVVPVLGDTGRGGPLTAIVATPDGRGYWTVNARGAVVAVGDAIWYGSWTRPPSAVTGLAVSADGRGYLLVASDGAVQAFGDARAAGSLSSPLHPPDYPASLQPPPVRAVGLTVLAPGDQAARRGPLRITFLGDSLAAQSARFTADYLAAHHLGAVVDDGAVLGCGVVGALTLSTYSAPGPPAPTLPACARWRELDTQAIAASHPDVVAVLLGYWESQRHGLLGATVSLTSSAAYRAYVADRLAAVDDLARAAGARVVFVEPPDFGDGTPDANVGVFDALVARVAGATGAGRFDLASLLDPGGRYRSRIGRVVVRAADGVHLERGRCRGRGRPGPGAPARARRARRPALNGAGPPQALGRPDDRWRAAAATHPAITEGRPGFPTARVLQAASVPTGTSRAPRPRSTAGQTQAWSW